MTIQTSELRTFEVMITCPSLAQSETVIVRAANAGEAQPAAIVVTTLQLTGQEIAFQVRELPRVS